MQEYYEAVVERFTSWMEALAANVPNLIAALVIVTLFALVAGPLSRLVKNAVGRVSDSDVIARLSARMSRYGILLIGVFFALGVVGLDKTVTSLLAGAGVLGIALGFAFQDIAANFVAGVLMGFRRPFALGDVIETNGYNGTVTNLNLRSTELETFSGQRVIVPNKEVFTNPLTNFHTTGVRRIELAVGVSYDDDLEKAVEVTRRAIAGFDFLAADKDVEVYAGTFGASSIDLKVRYWIPYPGEKAYPAAVHEGVVAIKKAYDVEGIDIPFPIRTLDFGDADTGVGAALSKLVTRKESKANGEEASRAS